MKQGSYQCIGFANKFYTLWTITNEARYICDSYGKYWVSGYDTRYEYHKNVSTSLDKVKEIYPDLSIDEELRGITRSFEKSSKNDLCPNIMKFGKYISHNLDELVDTDFGYVIWLCENSYSSNASYAKKLEKVQQHYKSIEDSRNKILSDKDAMFSEFIKEGVYEFVAESNLRISQGEKGVYAYINYDIDIDGNELLVTFKFNLGSFSVSEYNGYQYGLPLVKGKSKRMKGKNCRVEFTLDSTESYQVVVNNISVS